jgi:type II restriction enzyme
MANLNFYNKYLQLATIDEICEKLCSTLIETNYTYDYFVNWEKVIKNRDFYKYEIALLKSLKNSNNPTDDFRKLIMKYPEVIKVIPILIACREGILKVLDLIDTDLNYHVFNFSKSTFNNTEIDAITQFTCNTGLLNILCTMDSATDYLLGVEVGLDTNARKNRSGSFLEQLVTETLSELSQGNKNLIIIEQKSFHYVEDSYGIRIPIELRDRKFDYAVINNGKATNIEVNFYSGTGSKPSEIVSSYSERNRVLNLAGWKFVWLTDGQGWNKMKRPLYVGVSNIDYVINSYLLRKGLLKPIIL